MLELASCKSVQLNTDQDFVVRMVANLDGVECEYILSTVNEMNGSVVVIDHCQKYHVLDTVQIHRSL